MLATLLAISTHWYYLKDGLGSIVAVVDDSGSTVANRYGYDPYGKGTSTSGSVANPWGYAGGYLDPTGLVKFGTRYYDPNLGRFTQTDPISPVPSFPYADDSPAESTDRSGLYAVCVCEFDITNRGGSSPPPQVRVHMSSSPPSGRCSLSDYVTSGLFAVGAEASAWGSVLVYVVPDLYVDTDPTVPPTGGGPDDWLSHHYWDQGLWEKQEAIKYWNQACI